MMQTNPTQQKLSQLPASTHRPVMTIQLFQNQPLLPRRQQILATHLLCHTPALVPVETEDQRRSIPGRLITRRHLLQVVRQKLVRHPAKIQRNSPLLTLQQTQTTTMITRQPDHKIRRIPHSRTDQQQTTMPRQHPQTQLPHNPPLRIVEAVKFIHHHGRHVVKRLLLRIQQTIQQNLSHHHQNRSLHVLTTIARHQTYALLRKSPPHRRFPQLPILLLR